MSHKVILLNVFVVLSVVGHLADRTALALAAELNTLDVRDGQVLPSKPWPSLPAFDSLDDFGRNYFPRVVYEEARSQTDFDVLEITYASVGLPVRGMLIKPKSLGGPKWPAIIFNRGTGDSIGSNGRLRYSFRN